MNKAIVVVFAVITCLPVTTLTYGQQTVDELLEQVRQGREQIGQFGAQNELGRPLAEIVAEAETALVAATRKNEQLQQLFDNNERELAQKAETRRIETADMNDLFVVIRQFSGDTAARFNSSLVSAQLTDRNSLLDRLAQSDSIPAPGELRDLHLLMLQEMSESGKVVRFHNEVVTAAGVPETKPIVRIGTFNLIAADKFLHHDINSGTIQELARQPAGRYRKDANTLYDATGGVAAIAIDPTAGQLLSRLIQTPSIGERLKQGGPVGYIIVALGMLGLLIGLYRLIYLGAAGSRINRQLKSATPDQANALGRILSVYGHHAQVNTETLELKLDEAIIRETPVLEKWQVALKVIAAVAPLLGLLGTVVGMIETFHQITLSGTSDPRLMADGISKALVTTMLGLLVAIPMVLIHSLVTSRSKQLIEILEEQSAAIIANQAEKKL